MNFLVRETASVFVYLFRPGMSESEVEESFEYRNRCNRAPVVLVLLRKHEYETEIETESRVAHHHQD